MKGFTHEAIIIFPKPETISAQHISYKERLKKTIENLQAYLMHQGITLCALITDETAQQMKVPGIKFISNSTKVDKMFIRQNCDGFGDMDDGEDLYSDIVNKVADEIPMPRGIGMEERFKLILKREAKVNKLILTKAKLIIDLSVNRARTFKVPPSKENDPRIIIEMNKVSNQIQIQLGGRVINPNDILQFNGASRAVHLWREEDWS